MRAGFAEIDITPPLGGYKIGWLKKIVVEKVLDPIYARIAVFESDGAAIALIQLDTLSVRWTQVNEIRQAVAQRYGFPGASVMIAATHNHSGPAVATVGEVPRDNAYVQTMVDKVVEAFGMALENQCEAQVGYGHVAEHRVAHNRRVVMRQGTTRTHGSMADPDALYIEGPVDPELAVLAARGRDGALLGCVVNYTCHPTHHGGQPVLSAGYPGAVIAAMEQRGCPAVVFLNGACGNIHDADPIAGKSLDMAGIGACLAAAAAGVIENLEWRDELPLAAASITIQLPYRRATQEEVTGAIRGAQRFIDPTIYDGLVDGLLRRIEERGTQPAEVQALFAGDLALVGMPAEYFVELGLRIKEESYPRHTLVVGHANGMVGYIPTADAFRRGGYETTFSMSSRMAPEAGDLLADAALDLLCRGPA